MHRYLLTLEITPLDIGCVYNELPSHLTLMSRFLTNLSVGEVSNVVHPVFEQTAPVPLIFGETIQLGPKRVTAHMVHSRPEQQLHEALYAVLNDANVGFEYPEFVGTGHKPHVTARTDRWFNQGDELATSAAYLIEIVNRQRVVRSQFLLKGSGATIN